MMRLSLLSLVLFVSCSSVKALAGSAAAVLKDHSSAAISLFDNMRNPAALIAGGLVPLGIMTAPMATKEDGKWVAFMKKANVVIGVTSLLSQVLAVTYSSIAINKLSEVESPLTKGVAELIAMNYELHWIGTNVHFLLGLLGFGLIAGSRAYISNGVQHFVLGKATLGWAVAALFQALAVVNRGIALGSTKGGGASRFARNFGGLIWRYLTLVAQESKRGGFFSVAALVGGVWALYETIKVLLPEEKEA